jgi:prepilin-type N-terminal cleavage/methylation domain-containing protein
MRLAYRMRGYSLLELIIVLSILAVALGAGAYSTRQAFLREQIDGGARAVIYDLAGAQQQAVARRATVTVTFQGSAYLISSSGATLLNGTVPGHISFGESQTTLTFNRRGTPGGTLAVSMASATAGRSYSITINAGTGRASYSAY